MRMRYTNRLAVNWLLKNGYDHVWLKSHTRRKDWTYTQNTKYASLDIWNLFDGCCIYSGDVIFLQVKTNAWPKEDDIIQFIENKRIKVLAINAKKTKSKYIIHTRSYPKPVNPI